MIKHTDSIQIGTLISQRHPFVVHPYQRNYAWEEEDIEDFAKDLKALHKARVQDSSKTHFFGGLVLVERDVSGTLSGKEREIVDGQQRLATFFITIVLIAEALDKLAKEAEKQDNKEIQEEAVNYADLTRSDFLYYQEVVKGAGKQARLRLRLSKADREFFEQLMRGEAPSNPTRESHKRLRNASQIIWRLLVSPILDNDAISIEVKLEHLLQLRLAVSDDSYVIHITSDDKSEARRLFMVINDRGKSLVDGELLRVQTLELLDGYDEYQENVEGYWDQILARRYEEINQFLRSYYPSHIGQRAPRRDLFDHFCKHFFDYTFSLTLNDARVVVKHVRNIRDEFELYLKITNGDWPYDVSQVSAWDQDRLSRLIKELKHTLCIPLLLSAASCLHENQFSDLINLLDRFVFRYITIVRAHAGGLSDKYYQYASLIRKDINSYERDSLVDDLRKLATSNASDELFKLGLVEKLDYSKQNQRKTIKHFLTTVEDYYDWFKNGAAGKPRADKTRIFDLRQITIEHIYPQNASRVDEELEILKHNIGNLAFWAPNDNRAASNASFIDKRGRYGTSNIQLTKELAGFPEWGKAQIEERRDKLVKIALKIFRV